MTDPHNRWEAPDSRGSAPQPPQYQQNPYASSEYDDYADGAQWGDDQWGYEEPEFYDERKSSPLLITLIVLAVLAIAVFVGFIVFSNSRSDSGEDPASVVTITEDAEVADDESEAVGADDEPESRPEDPELPSVAEAVNEAARSGEPSGNLNNVWKSGPTSDEFALDVRDAYVDAYLDGDEDDFDHVVNVYSSVTGLDYTMTCEDNGSYVHCTGGNSANVYIA